MCDELCGNRLQTLRADHKESNISRRGHAAIQNLAELFDHLHPERPTRRLRSSVSARGNHTRGVR